MPDHEKKKLLVYGLVQNKMLLIYGLEME